MGPVQDMRFLRSGRSPSAMQPNEWGSAIAVLVTPSKPLHYPFKIENFRKQLLNGRSCLETKLGCWA